MGILHTRCTVDRLSALGWWHVIRLHASLAVLGFALLVACGRSPSCVDLEAGPVTEGLRLDARFDVRRGLVRYRVSNGGEQPFGYTHRHFGDVLEVRREGDTTWHALPRRPEVHRIVSGMGPMPRDVRMLAPGGFLPRDAYCCAVDQRRFTPNEGNARPGLAIPQADEEFTLDLLDFVWPKDLDGQVLELRIVQVHPDWSELPRIVGTTAVRIPSAVFGLEPTDLPPAIRAELDWR